MSAAPPPSASAQQKPQVNVFFHSLGKIFMRILGWKIVGEFPNHPKIILAAYPHTTNWDGIFVILSSWVIRVRFSWLGKIQLMRGPLGPPAKALGGIPIDRSASFNAVEQTVQYINKHERVALAIAPEGTRRKTNYWRTGFYWIAYGAGIPIVCADQL
jgi:1-acyl-sn-glycerol-3-phosphate acyltransferase